MTLEELSIIYTADVSGALQSIRLLSREIQKAGEEMDQGRDQFYFAGRELGEGLAQGILSREGQVMEAARKIADAAARALRGALQIHSPSKVTQAAGDNFSKGLAQGILGSCDRVEKAAFQAGNFSLPLVSFPSFPENAGLSRPENINLTVPLEVDGYQLGLAAIRGINRVTRATGRTELTL